MRLWGIVAGLALAILAAGPAAASTIATFALNDITFNDGTTAIGTFSLDVTSHTIKSVSIETFNGTEVGGETYSGSTLDKYTFAPTTLLFRFPIFDGFSQLSLVFPLSDATDLTSLPTFSISSGTEASFMALCFIGGRKGCPFRTILSGQIKTLSVATVATTPIPATLPLLATALGGMGFVGWRRMRPREPMQAAV